VVGAIAQLEAEDQRVATEMAALAEKRKDRAARRAQIKIMREQALQARVQQVADGSPGADGKSTSPRLLPVRSQSEVRFDHTSHVVIPLPV